MAARKKKVTKFSKKYEDQNLMILAGVAAILVMTFSIFAYRSKNANATPSPSPVASPTPVSTLKTK